MLEAPSFGSGPIFASLPLSLPSRFLLDPNHRISLLVALLYLVDCLMKLEDFPLGILIQILNDDVSFLIIELWKCGSTALNGKLRLGIVSMTLRYSAEATTTRYPRCLKEFVNLQRLSINSDSEPLCSIPTLRRELRKLPSSLTDLELTFKGVVPALFMEWPRDEKVLTLDDQDEPPSPKRVKHEELVDLDADYEETWNLDITWPHMKRLKLWGPPATITSRVFALLPRSLEHLHLNQGLGRLQPDFSTLPRTLKTLILSDGSIDSVGLRHLPQSLTDIGNSLNEQALCLLASEPSLLPNLTTFPIDSPLGPDSTLLEQLLDGTVHCPKNLKHLVFSQTRPEQIFHEGFSLPAELEGLELNYSEAEFDLNAEWLTKYIPRTLTMLKVRTIDFEEIDSSMWPPHLTTLRVADEKFGSQWLHKLPRTLTALYSGDLSLNAEDFTADPSALLEAGIETLNGVDKDLWSTIKLTLKDSSFNSESANEYISAVESGRLFGFPLGLTALDISVFTSDASSSLILPPRVRKLVLRPTAALQVDEFFRLLPPSVEELHLHDASHPSIILNCIDSWDSQSIEPSSTWLFKSKNLTRLDLLSTSTGWEKIIKYLPRTLLSLNCHLQASVFSPETILELPPSLTSLSLECTQVITDDWTAALPRSLITLRGTLSMTGSDFAHLPPGLCYLNASYHGVVTLDDVLALPRTLRSIRTPTTVTPTTMEDNPELIANSQVFPFARDYHPFYNIFQTPRDAIKTMMRKWTARERVLHENSYADVPDSSAPFAHLEEFIDLLNGKMDSNYDDDDEEEGDGANDLCDEEGEESDENESHAENDASSEDHEALSEEREASGDSIDEMEETEQVEEDGDESDGNDKNMENGKKSLADDLSDHSNTSDRLREYYDGIACVDIDPRTILRLGGTLSTESTNLELAEFFKR